MSVPSLQSGIDRAGSPMALLWREQVPPWRPPVVEPEYSGWRVEQAAWRETVAISDLSYHMFDTVIEGPDAVRMLSELSANDYTRFAVHQAKQFLPVTAEGWIVNDGILLRETAERFVLSGVPPAHRWVRYHAERGGYDVEVRTIQVRTDAAQDFEPGGAPERFRFQLQGPRATDLVAAVFAGPLPPTKFFHATPVSLQGRSLLALRHGMAGEPGYELIGDYRDAALVKEHLMRVGEHLGLEHVGSIAYPTSGPESGWIPCPVPAIYTAPELDAYRQWVPLLSYEGQNHLYGSHFSADVEDYYVTPFELGYGRLVSFDHDFLGRDALVRRAREQRRRRVTLVYDVADVEAKLGRDHGIVYTLACHRVEDSRGRLLGTTAATAFVDPLGTLVGLAVVDCDRAEPGTDVRVVWGNHPGPGAPDDVTESFPRVRATVEVTPYGAFARAGYRRN